MANNHGGSNSHETHIGFSLTNYIPQKPHLCSSRDHSRKRKTMTSSSSPDDSESIVYTYGLDIINVSGDIEITDLQMNMQHSVTAVEFILNYKFKDKSLLEEALTHSSFTNGSCYQRLEFLGDAVIGLAISNFVYLNYPHVDPGQLSLLRAANISTEKLARVAVQHQLYKYVRHNAAVLSDKVREFVIAVKEEEDTVVHGGLMKAPKVLADIVESVVAAVYVDCGFNLQVMWLIIRELLEPMVMLDVLEKQPQPITMLFEACQKEGKYLDIRHQRKGEKDIASVYVDGTFVASGSSENKENAKLQAAKAALFKLKTSKTDDSAIAHTFCGINEAADIEGAKRIVQELCDKKKWGKPRYRVDQEFGPAHDRRYISSVKVEVSDKIFTVTGKERSRVKDAQNSAASVMFCALRESGYV